MTDAQNTMVYIMLEDMIAEFDRVFRKAGLTPERAAACAEIFAKNSYDGVVSHGYNRVLSLAKAIARGDVRPDASPEMVASFGAWEQWDGNLGPGVLNAVACTDRAMALARENGMGAVALRNTNHWVRPGAYGWRAAEAGFVFMCWTNTEPNTPPWGGTEKRVGNNPLVLAVPRETGPVVLDIAMSQFSYGRMHVAAMRNETLSVPAGYDAEGNITSDPAAILETRRPLPIGYWKGSGLSLLLDLIAHLLSGGQSTRELGEKQTESGVSQMYIAFDISRAASSDFITQRVTETIDFVLSSPPVDADHPVQYPGGGVMAARARNAKNGIAVDNAVWEAITAY